VLTAGFRIIYFSATGKSVFKKNILMADTPKKIIENTKN